MVRAVLAVLMIIALLFMADQEFADGHYTRIFQKAVVKVKTAVGIQTSQTWQKTAQRSNSERT